MERVRHFVISGSVGCGKTTRALELVSDLLPELDESVEDRMKEILDRRWAIYVDCGDRYFMSALSEFCGKKYTTKGVWDPEKNSRLVLLDNLHEAPESTHGDINVFMERQGYRFVLVCREDALEGLRVITSRCGNVRVKGPSKRQQNMRDSFGKDILEDLSEGDLPSRAIKAFSKGDFKSGAEAVLEHSEKLGSDEASQSMFERLVSSGLSEEIKMSKHWTSFCTFVSTGYRSETFPYALSVQIHRLFNPEG